MGPVQKGLKVFSYELTAFHYLAAKFLLIWKSITPKSG